MYAQLWLAQAVAASAGFNWASAAGYTAAAAGAYAASGAVQSFATGGSFLTDGDQQIRVGDNPGGVERVTVEPISSGGSAGEQRIIIQLDGQAIADFVTDSSKNGQTQIYSGSIVN